VIKNISPALNYKKPVNIKHAQIIYSLERKENTAIINTLRYSMALSKIIV
jgi:hypothetical protein